jgi:ectoine hydroxylase-related dioxygenase (phytanoyl-CoA dioxygenase family)
VQARYHRDFAKDFVADKVLSLNAMIAVDPFNGETGGTWVVPGTHRSAEVPSMRYLDAHAVQVEAAAGSILFFDSLLIHKAGGNRSASLRRAINHQYTRPFIKQQLDYAGMFRGQVDPESRFAQVIGTWTMPPRDVAEYRVDPDKRTYRGGQG